MNPIMQELNKSSSQLGNLMNILSGDKNQIMKQVTSNPQFQRFCQENRGKSPEQIARENGIDPSILKFIK